MEILLLLIPGHLLTKVWIETEMILYTPILIPVTFLRRCGLKLCQLCDYIYQTRHLLTKVWIETLLADNPTIHFDVTFLRRCGLKLFSPSNLPSKAVRGHLLTKVWIETFMVGVAGEKHTTSPSYEGVD